MNHAIEQFTDGTAAFYSARQPAWHSLGIVTNEAKTLDEALAIAQMNWVVYKTPLPVHFGVGADGEGKYEVPDTYAVYRDHPKFGIQGLGIVGNQYTVVQNREVGELAELIVDESGGIWETMGSLHGGKKVFMSIKLPNTITFGGQDRNDLYLVIGSSHDGSMAVTAIVTNVRVVCQNTWNAAFKDAASKYFFKHTSGIRGRVAQAREALQLSYRYHEEFEKHMQKWLLKSVTLDRVKKIVDQVVPDHPLMSPSQFSRVEKTREDVMERYFAPTQDFGRGSYYGVFNAFTEYDQWFRSVKGPDKEVSRASKTLFDTSTKLSSRAFAVLSST